jgi:hypothetical protein
MIAITVNDVVSVGTMGALQLLFSDSVDLSAISAIHGID